MRVPVDQPLAAKDQPALVEFDEDLEHRVVEVALLAAGAPGAPDMVKALRDRSKLSPSRRDCSRIVPPDCAFHSQTLATKASRPISRRAGVARLRQLALDDHLRGDAGVVEAGLPEHVEAPHPVPAGEDVHQRVVEGVAHVQAAGDVRRRQQDREGLGPGPRVGAGAEGIGRLPGGADRGLGRGGVEGLFHGHGDVPASGSAVS